MTFDYDKYTSSGDYVKFVNIGDQVIGVIKEIREAPDYNGTPCPELILEVEDGDSWLEKTLTASQVLLKKELAEKRPSVGDKVRITYSGQSEGKPGRAPAKEFTVDVKPGPHEMAQPAVANSTDPFE